MRIQIALVFLAIVACAPGTHSSSTPDWYHRVRMLDVSGDGVSDSLILVAQGTRSDSLQIAFAIKVDGHEVLKDAWASDYMLVDPPDSAVATTSARDGYIRAGLDETLNGVSLEPLAGLSLVDNWRELPSECDGDPRSCIANELKSEALRARWDGLPVDSARALRDRIANAPYDTVTVEQIFEEMRTTQSSYLSLSYGYETSAQYGWSPRTKRFFLLFACC